jgi:hypothetical protein
MKLTEERLEQIKNRRLGIQSRGRWAYQAKTVEAKGWRS